MYVTGSTSSTNFPTQNPIQSTDKSSFGNVIVTKLNASGSALVYSTYLGGTTALNADVAYGIAVDASGNAYIAGDAWSTDFPTQSPFQSTKKGSNDNAFVAKLNASGSALVYSTYAYVTGTAGSTDFPTQSGRLKGERRRLL